jgi:plastocyanin
VVAALLSLLVAVTGLGGGHVAAYTPRVLMVDNDAPFAPAGNPGLGLWGFAPAHLAVYQGEALVFENPATNKRPHTVTSLTWGGTPTARTLESGTLFDSTIVMPGNTFTLDTTPLPPGQYVYYCTLHPWMLGTVTVEPPEGA